MWYHGVVNGFKVSDQFGRFAVEAVQAGAGPRVLIVSNGHGEDLLGVLFAQALKRVAGHIHVDAFPIVGLGDAYRRAQIPVVGVQKAMPTGGFVRQGVRPFLTDVRAGLIGLTRRQMRALANMRADYGWAVAMGDILPLWLCGRKLKLPFVFFPTAKSDYIRPHLRIEVAWMRRWPKVVFPRDAKTAASLRAAGVEAVYVGNLMMDALAPSGRPLPGEGPLVALLPGSRAEAYRNARLLLGAVLRLPVEHRYALALASELDPGELAAVAQKIGWEWQPSEDNTADAGLVGTLQAGRRAVLVYKGRFADILHEATIVLGMAGTANEQAVGLGRPVVTCPGEGPQFTPKFVAAQKRLLGDAVLVTESSPAALAAGVMDVLADPAVYERMAQAGRERMGEPGGAERAARYCLELEGLGEMAR